MSTCSGELPYSANHDLHTAHPLQCRPLSTGAPSLRLQVRVPPGLSCSLCCCSRLCGAPHLPSPVELLQIFSSTMHSVRPRSTCFNPALPALHTNNLSCRVAAVGEGWIELERPLPLDLNADWQASVQTGGSVQTPRGLLLNGPSGMLPVPCCAGRGSRVQAGGAAQRMGGADTPLCAR